MSSSKADREKIALAMQDGDDVLLAELGYKSEFKREFKLYEVVFFAFSIMGVIASVTSTWSFMLVSVL